MNCRSNLDSLNVSGSWLLQTDGSSNRQSQLGVGVNRRVFSPSERERAVHKCTSRSRWPACGHQTPGGQKTTLLKSAKKIGGEEVPPARGTPSPPGGVEKRRGEDVFV